MSYYIKTGHPRTKFGGNVLLDKSILALSFLLISGVVQASETRGACLDRIHMSFNYNDNSKMKTWLHVDLK